MRQTRGCLGNTPFFWQFVNDAHGSAGWLKKVVSLGRQHLRRIRPLVDGRHSLPPFFASGDRTVAGVHDLLRRFSHSLSRCISKKVRWSSNEGHGPLEVRSPGASFCSSWFWVGNLPPRAIAQSVRASSVGYVQFIARTFGYAAMS